MADAWALTDSTRNGARATLSSNIIVGANSGDYIEFDLEGFAGNEADTFRLTGISSSFSEVVEIKPTILTVKGNNTTVNFNLTRPPINTRFSARVERVGTDTFSVFLNGVFIDNATLANNLTIEQFFGLASFTNQTFVGTIYSIEASTSGGTPTNRWINRTSGTGSVWTDEIGGNDATLNTDFPTDGSQWILYDDGVGGGDTITADLSLSISKPTFAVSSNVTAPTNSASITFTNSKPAFSILADSIAPSSVANVSFEIDKPSFAVTATSAQPSITTSVSFSLSAPQFSASGMTYISDKPISTPTKRIDGFAAKSLRIDGKTTPLRIDGNIH